jgi:hypothetical protein
MSSKKVLLSIFLLSAAALFAVTGNNAEVSASEIVPNIATISDESEDLIISDVMTFEEMVDQVSEDFGISTKEAQEKLGYSDAKARSARAARAQYRTISSQFTSTSTFKPTMRFYCETTESGGFRAIKKVLQVNMIRSSGGVSKQFSGTVYVNLEDPNRIFYTVNGDFFNNGTTTVNSEVSIGVGKSANVKFGVSYASNHYKYTYVEKRVTF